MRILMIGPFPPPVNGVTTANDTLFKGLSANHRVDRINLGYPALREDLGEFSLKKILHSIKTYFLLYKVVLAEAIYMTPGQSFYGILKYAPFLLLSKLMRKKTLVHVHGDHVWRQFQELKGLKKSIYFQLYSMFDVGIALSDSLKKNLLPFLAEGNIALINNFVSEDVLSRLDAETVSSKDASKLKILFLSNLMKEKGIIDFLEACLILQEKNIPFEAVVAGAMDPRSSHAIKPLLLQLKDRVSYPGPVEGEQKINLLKSSNIFVLPTYYRMEGQPLALLEAMAAGNIILTTDHAGIPDIFVPEVNGFYVKKKAPDDIADRLIELSSTLPAQLPIMKTNYEQAASLYTAEKFVKRIEALIQN